MANVKVLRKFKLSKQIADLSHLVFDGWKLEQRNAKAVKVDGSVEKSTSLETVDASVEKPTSLETSVLSAPLDGFATSAQGIYVRVAPETPISIRVEASAETVDEERLHAHQKEAIINP